MRMRIKKMVTSGRELAARTQGTFLNENTVCLDLGVGNTIVHIC